MKLAYSYIAGKWLGRDLNLPLGTMGSPELRSAILLSCSKLKKWTFRQRDSEVSLELLSPGRELLSWISLWIPDNACFIRYSC